MATVPFAAALKENSCEHGKGLEKVLSYEICDLSKRIFELGLISWPGEISPGSGEIHKRAKTTDF